MFWTGDLQNFRFLFIIFCLSQEILVAFFSGPIFFSFKQYCKKRKRTIKLVLLKIFHRSNLNCNDADSTRTNTELRFEGSKLNNFFTGWINELIFSYFGQILHTSVSVIKEPLAWKVCLIPKKLPDLLSNSSIFGSMKDTSIFCFLFSFQ